MDEEKKDEKEEIKEETEPKETAEAAEPAEDDVDFTSEQDYVGEIIGIIRSGVSDEEIQAGTIGYQTADMAFSDANAGQVYTIDTSVEAKAGRGVEKTKYKYNEGTWSDYTA